MSDETDTRQIDQTKQSCIDIESVHDINIQSLLL